MLIALGNIKTRDGTILLGELAEGLSSEDEEKLEKLGYLKPAPRSKNTEGVELGKLVNLNTATVDQLKSLKHIGPKSAQKIVDSRPLESVDQIKEIADLADEKYAAIEYLLTL